MAMGTLNEVPSLLSLQLSPVGLACFLHEVISPSFRYSTTSPFHCIELTPPPPPSHCVPQILPPFNFIYILLAL